MKKWVGDTASASVVERVDVMYLFLFFRLAKIAKRIEICEQTV